MIHKACKGIVCKKVRVDHLILLYIVREQKLKSFSEWWCELQTNYRLVEVTNRHHHLLQYIHRITGRVLLYVVLPVCNIFLSKNGLQYNNKYSQNHVQQCTQLYHLDNRSYSNIQPLIYPTYIIKIGEWLSLWDFFDNLSQKLIRTAQHNSHQTCNEVETSPCDQF